MASKSARKRRKRRPPATGRVPETAAAPDAKPAPAPAKARAARMDEAPPPPWGSFPLIELSVLVGIVMLVVGFFFVEGTRGAILIGTGLLLGSIGGLELSLREHFSGFRSHTLILAGLPALVVLGVLFYAADGLPPLLRAAIGLAVFVAAALLLSRAFANRSGGVRYRFGSRSR